MGEIKNYLKRYENGYLITDISAIGGVIYYIITKKIECLIIAAIAVVMIFIVASLHHGSRVINRSGKRIKAKDEDGSTIYYVEDGEFKNHIDGINVDGTVYKIPDGVRVVVRKGGKIRTYSLLGGLINAVSGSVLTSAPDKSWDLMFNVED